MIHGTLMVSISFIPAFIQDQRKQQGVNEAASKHTIEKLKTILGFHEFSWEFDIICCSSDPSLFLVLNSSFKTFKIPLQYQNLNSIFIPKYTTEILWFDRWTLLAIQLINATTIILVHSHLYFKQVSLKNLFDKNEFFCVC